MVELSGQGSHARGGTVIGRGIRHGVDVGQHHIAVPLKVGQQIRVGATLGSKHPRGGKQHDPGKQTHEGPYPFFRELLFFRLPPFLAGTLAPFFRASDSPIAIACSRLLTLPPLPDFPRRSVPRLRRLIALFTLLPAPLLYFLRLDFREERFRVAAMRPPGEGESYQL